MKDFFLIFFIGCLELPLARYSVYFFALVFEKRKDFFFFLNWEKLKVFFIWKGTPINGPLYTLLVITEVLLKVQNLKMHHHSCTFLIWNHLQPHKEFNVHGRWQKISTSGDNETNEPPHDKTNKMTVCPAKTQISLSIGIAKDPSFLHADTEDSDQTGRMPFCWFYHETAQMSEFIWDDMLILLGLRIIGKDFVLVWVGEWGEKAAVP